MSWSLYLYKNLVWTSENSVPDPDGIELEDTLISTIEFQKLIDGSLAATQPEKTYNTEPIYLSWSKRYATTLSTRIENYIKSGSGLKFVSHTGKEFIGTFTRFINRWGLTGSTQKYYLTVEFQQLETEMLRDQNW